MKNILIALFTLIFFWGCSKSTDNIAAGSNPGNAETNSIKNPVDTSVKSSDTTDILKPSAGFKIVNLNDAGKILELQSLVFQNTSINASSYKWDLGTSANYSDGNSDIPMQYSNKAEPVNIYMTPCMQTVTITLTASNDAGEKSVKTQSFEVYCFRGVGGKHPLMHRLY